MSTAGGGGESGFDLDHVMRLIAPVAGAERVPVDWASARCRASDRDRYSSDEPLGSDDRARCRACPVRTECLVEGVWFGRGRQLPRSAEEMWGHFGGLGPAERWELLEAVRFRASCAGVTLPEQVIVRGEMIVARLHDGDSLNAIADELELDEVSVRREAIDLLHGEGWSNRAIADLIGSVSYKTVERVRRTLITEPRFGQEDETWAA